MALSTKRLGVNDNRSLVGCSLTLTIRLIRIASLTLHSVAAVVIRIFGIAAAVVVDLVVHNQTMPKTFMDVEVVLLRGRRAHLSPVVLTSMPTLKN